MNMRSIALVLLLSPGAVLAAQPATEAEPAVVTSPAAAPRAAASAVSAAPRPATSSATIPDPPASPAAPAAPTPRSRSAAAPPAASSRTNADRIELEATQITGNAELPRVMYVVPWKRAELGDLAGRPAKSLLDEVLAPVDRDVFRRQNRYYEALQPDAAKATPEGEK